MKTSKPKVENYNSGLQTVLVETPGLDSEDIESRPMGSQGEDIILGKQSRQLFPFSVECKNQDC